MRIAISKYKILTFGLAALVVLGVTLILVWKFSLYKGTTIRGAVVTNGHGCSEVGKSILQKGGSVADAAIATLFCEGVAMPQSMGLGGGFLLTIYERDTGTVQTLNARETAPAASSQDMFSGNSSLSQNGGLSIAVPGELKGYWYLYQQYGNLPWKDLVQPTIDMCRNGIYVTKFLAQVFGRNLELLYADPVLRDIFIDPETNSTLKEGQYYKRLRLAETLEVIAEENADALYSKNGSLIKGFVKDLQDQGGIITEEDMTNYEPVWSEPISAELSKGYKLYTTSLPGSGPVLAFILNILDGFLDSSLLYNVQTFQRIIESFKFGYGHRTSLGGDIQNVGISSVLESLTSKSYAENIRKMMHDDSTSPNASYYGANSAPVDDHGTAHISILAPNGDAISVTSTINLVFGAGFASNSTGIILNDEMDDFSSPNITNHFGLPPSPNNFITPGRRPLSSMVPSIIVKDRNVALVVGSAGGSKITTGVATIIIKHLMYDINLVEATDERRFHHQLFPMMIEYEEGFNETYSELVNNLTTIGHQSTYSPTDGFSAITSITAKNGDIQAAYDKRRGGYISYIEN